MRHVWFRKRLTNLAVFLGLEVICLALGYPAQAEHPIGSVSFFGGGNGEDTIGGIALSYVRPLDSGWFAEVDVSSQSIGADRLNFVHVHLGTKIGQWQLGGFSSYQTIESRRFTVVGLEAQRLGGRVLPNYRLGLERRRAGEYGATASMGLFMPFMGGLGSGAYFTHADGRNSLQLLLQFDARSIGVRASVFASSAHGMGSDSGQNSFIVGLSIPLGDFTVAEKIDHDDLLPRTLLLQESNAKLVSSAASVSPPPPVTPPGQGGSPPGLGGGSPPGQGGTPPGLGGGTPPGQGGTPPGQGGSPPGQGGGPPPGKGGGKP